MTTQIPSIGRRSFVSSLAFTAAALAREPRVRAETTDEPELISARGPDRREIAFRLRVDTARLNRATTPPNLPHPTNGDEDRYPTKIATYTKGLQHHDNGEVVLSSYASLARALECGSAADFEAIVLGGPSKLVNPQSGLAFELMGGDPRRFVQPPPPAFASLEAAAEIAENYWMAILRDIPFSQYRNHPFAAAAAADLSRFGDEARVPKHAGSVVQELLFRGLTEGDLRGPYLSQFFYQPLTLGATVVEQAIRTYATGVDYLTDFGSYLAAQRGATVRPPAFGAKVFMRSGRDIGRWVHIDVLFQAYFQAALILFNMGAPVGAGNPYRNSRTQVGFGTLGEPALAGLLGEVAQRALRAVWFQKWFVHRRARPEVFAARIERILRAGARYPVHPEILGSLSSSSRLGGRLGASALLPMAFPEGAPYHPSYGAGHATTAGACTTILKAWFDGSFTFASPLQPIDDGTRLIPYMGPDVLTVEGELNKLASNVALGRNIAGVHWRSDATASLALGEAIAIQYLRELKPCLSEAVTFSFRAFSGARVVV